MCTTHNAVKKYEALVDGPPQPVEGFKALYRDSLMDSWGSAIRTFNWQVGWNKAVNAREKVASLQEDINEGAIHVALTYKRAQVWLKSGRCNAIIKVKFYPNDIVAVQANGECAVRRVYVEELADVVPAMKLAENIKKAVKGAIKKSLKPGKKPIKKAKRKK